MEEQPQTKKTKQLNEYTNQLKTKMAMDDKLKSHFINLYFLALADNEVDTSELEVLFQIGKLHGVSKEEIEKLLLHPDLIEFTIPDDTLTKVQHLYDFVQIILADGVVDDREKVTLRNFCQNFGFEEQHIPKIMEYLIEEGRKGTEKEVIIEQVKQTL